MSESRICRVTGLSSPRDDLFIEYAGEGGGFVTRLLWPEKEREGLGESVGMRDVVETLIGTGAKYCPRCEERFLFPEPRHALNQTSHFDRRIRLCNPCGSEESLIEFSKQGVQPLNLSEEMVEREKRTRDLSVDMGLPPTIAQEDES